MSIGAQLNKAVDNLRTCRENIIIKGGNIAENAGFNDIPKAILDLPVGKTSIVEVIDDSVANTKPILAGAKSKAILNSIGGMTYRKASHNLFPCPKEGIDIIMNSGTVGMVVGTITLKAGTYSYMITDADGVEGVYAPFEDICLSTETDPWNYTALENTFTLTASTTVSLIAVNLSNTEDISKNGVRVMLNKGEPMLFVPYEPYLEDTKVTEVISYGANMLPNTYNSTQSASKGISINANEDGSLTLKGTATQTGKATFYIYKNYNVSVDYPAGAYSIPALEGSKSNTYVISIYLQNENKKEIASFSTANTTRTITITEKCKSVSVAISYNITTVGEVVDKTFYPMLNYGTTAVPYTPYREPIRYPIPEAIQAQISGKGVLNIQNNNYYSDTANFDSGKHEYKMNTLILNGTENWKSEGRKNGSKDFNFYMDNPIGKPLMPVVCNYYESYLASSTGKDNNMWISGTGKLNCTAVGFASVDEWKAHLAKLYASGNPVTVTYPLAEPTEEALAAPFDKIIEVFAGGYLEFVTDNGNAPPSKITYIRSLE